MIREKLYSTFYVIAKDKSNCILTTIYTNDYKIISKKKIF